MTRCINDVAECRNPGGALLLGDLSSGMVFKALAVQLGFIFVYCVFDRGCPMVANKPPACSDVLGRQVPAGKPATEAALELLTNLMNLSIQRPYLRCYLRSDLHGALLIDLLSMSVHGRNAHPPLQVQKNRRSQGLRRFCAEANIFSNPLKE